MFCEVDHVAWPIRSFDIDPDVAADFDVKLTAPVIRVVIFVSTTYMVEKRSG